MDAHCLVVVIKHEAMAVRRGRSELVAEDDVDYDVHASVDAADPAERVVSSDQSARAAEALRRLKPQELRAIWLKALGHTYDEIADVTGYSRTKVNRCITEGRKAFLERYAGIEAGDECAIWRPRLSAVVDGEASASDLADLRPHVRNCPSCRATLKGLREAERPLAAVLPVGLLGAGLKVGGLLERLMPLTTAGDPAATAGGVGVLGVSGAKLIGLMAAGAAATAGGGLVVAHEHHATGHHVSAKAADRAPATKRVVATTPLPAAPASTPLPNHSATIAHARRSRPHTAQKSHKLTAKRSRATSRIEFAPAGSEVSSTPAQASSTPGATPTSPPPTTSAASKPAAPAPKPSADATSGEFAPQP